MSELIVKRWRRFGHDRVYVSLGDGSRIGWLDIITGEATLERPELGAEFHEALREHGHDVAPQPRPPAGPSDPTTGQQVDGKRVRSTPGDMEPYAVVIDWRDISTTQAGAAAAEQAVTARKSSPVTTLITRLLGVHTEERAWRVGAVGERKVAARLERLPDSWKTLHAIRVGTWGSDIDHLVIGPGGVFTINAKHHPDCNVWVAGDTFMVNGRRYPYVRNARHEARRAARLLSAATGTPVSVTGMIAIVGATGGFTVKEQPADVRVVARKQIHRTLARVPPALPPGRVRDIYAAARRSKTWQP